MAFSSSEVSQLRQPDLAGLLTGNIKVLIGRSRPAAGPRRSSDPATTLAAAKAPMRIYSAAGGLSGGAGEPSIAFRLEQTASRPRGRGPSGVAPGPGRDG